VSGPRDDLLRLLPPGALDAIERLIAERVHERLAAAGAERDGDPGLVSLAEAARLLDCSPDAVRKRARRGRLDVRYHGRRVYVTRASLRRLDGPG
jgi:Helix-turn-helix domain